MAGSRLKAGGYMLDLSALFSSGSYVFCQYLDLQPVSDQAQREWVIANCLQTCFIYWELFKYHPMSDIEEHCLTLKPHIYFLKLSFSDPTSSLWPTWNISNVTVQPQTSRMRCCGHRSWQQIGVTDGRPLNHQTSDTFIWHEKWKYQWL